MSTSHSLSYQYLGLGTEDYRLSHPPHMSLLSNIRKRCSAILRLFFHPRPRWADDPRYERTKRARFIRFLLHFYAIRRQEDADPWVHRITGFTAYMIGEKVVTFSLNSTLFWTR